MTRVEAVCSALVFLALAAAAPALAGQTLPTAAAQVIVDVAPGYIDDVAFNPADGHLLVLVHCDVDCDGGPRHPDHYTTDGTLLMRIPITSRVNRILPAAGNTLFVAYETRDETVPAGTGLYQIVANSLVPVPVATPFDGQTNPCVDSCFPQPAGPTNTVWTTGPDGAIYLLQTLATANPSSVVMRIMPDGIVSEVGTVPAGSQSAGMSVLSSGIYVDASYLRMYRFLPGADSAEEVSAPFGRLSGAPVDGEDGYVYGTHAYDTFPQIYRMRPDGSDFQHLNVGTALARLVVVHPGIVYASVDRSLFQVLPYRSVGDLPTSPSKIFIDADAHLYGQTGSTLFRVWDVVETPPDTLLYNASSGSYQFSQVLPSGSSPPEIGFGPGAWAAGWRIFAADFNRDTERDLLFYNPASGFFIKGIGIGNGQFTFPVAYYWAPNWDIHVVDLNGDGRSDLFLYNATTGRWFAAMTVGDGTGDFDYTRTGVWAPGWTITVVDWEGDGRNDLFLYNKVSGLWAKVTTLADASFGFPAWGYWAAGWNVYNADFNGDGRSELFLYANAGTPIAGRNFVVRAVGDTFEYDEGIRWGQNWNVTMADLDGDGRSDIFLYDPATGRWYEVFKDGADSYYSGQWATNWSTALLRGAGNAGVLTNTDAVMVYNATTGMYFKVVPHGRGTFDYTSGTWPTGMTLIPLR